MNENKFWLGVWAIVGMMICTLILSIMFYNVNANNNLTDLIAKGADPIAASCAIQGISASSIICSQVAKK